MMETKEDTSTTQHQAPQATYLQGSGITNQAMHEESPRRTLQINLFVCNVTVWIMFVVAGVVMAFALLAMDELRDEYIYTSHIIFSSN